MKITLKEQITELMRTIVKEELRKEPSSLQCVTYNNQRALINQIFSLQEYNKGTVILRLTILDSLYSTNAAYSYFAIENIANEILKLGNEEQAREYFNQVVLEENDSKGIFSIHYGLRKNLSNGSLQMSLLSKYAYYVLGQDKNKYPLGFPIYDRLAKEAYSIVYKMLEIEPSEELSLTEDTPIEVYIKALKQLKNTIFNHDNLFEGYQQFDVLDAYLWRMGKFSHGNLSLILNKEEYEKFIVNIQLDITSNGGLKQYKSNMIQHFNKTSAVKRIKEKDIFDFNTAVVICLRDTRLQPFDSLERAKYLKKILEHWRYMTK